MLYTRNDVEKKVPHSGDKYNVIICGGGLAGMSAAIAAGKTGGRVLMIEAKSLLGGVTENSLWMSVNRLWMYHTMSRGGVHQMLIDKMLSFGKDGAIRNIPNNLEYDNLDFHPEYFRKACFELLEENGCDYILYSAVTDVIMRGNRIIGVVVNGKYGRQEYYADVIVDATGDADVAYHAGVETKMGSDVDHRVMPVSLVFALCNCDVEKFFAFKKHVRRILPNSNLTPEEKHAIVGMRNANDEDDNMTAIINKARELGYRTSRGYRFDLTTIPGCIGVNNVGPYEIGQINGLDPRDLTIAERLAIDVATDFVRIARDMKIPGMEDCCLMRAGAGVSVRETRRIVGDYIFTADDARRGSEFDDNIARNYEGVIDAVGYLSATVYDFGHPYRMLLPCGVEGMLVAGRCSSNSYEAHNCNRSMGNVIGLGQAAGVAAALASRNGVTPRKQDVKEIQAALKNLGVSVFKTDYANQIDPDWFGKN